MSLKDTYCSAWEAFSVSIEENKSLTDKINLGGLRLFGICMPAAWSDANLTFQMSPDGEQNWSNIKAMNGVEVTAVVGAGDCVVLDPTKFATFQYLRVRSGTAASPINQVATRNLCLILRGV